MKTLAFCCIIILCSLQAASGVQPVLTINLGTSPYRTADGLSARAANLCYGIGFEAQDTSKQDLAPFINYEHNSWSAVGLAWSSHVVTFGFKVYITKNIFTSCAIGAGNGNEKIAAYFIPGIGAEFKIADGTAIFADARYTMLVQDAPVYYLPIRAGLKVVLSGK